MEDIVIEPQEPAEAVPTAIEEKFVPQKTFDSTYGKLKGAESKLKGYEGLGSADDIRAQQERLRQMDAAEVERNRPASEVEQISRRKSIRDELFETLPELRDLGSIKDLTEREETRNISDASTYLSASLSKLGVSVDTETQDGIENYLMSQIGREGMERITRRDFAVMDSHVEEFVKNPMFSHNFKPKEPTPAPPARHAPAATPAPGQEKSIVDLNPKELADLAWAKFNENE